MSKLVSNFNVNNVPKRGLVWSNEANAFLLKTCKCLDEPSGNSWIPDDGSSGHTAIHPTADGSDKEYIRIAYDPNSNYRRDYLYYQIVFNDAGGQDPNGVISRCTEIRCVLEDAQDNELKSYSFTNSDRVPHRARPIFIFANVPKAARVVISLIGNNTEDAVQPYLYPAMYDKKLAFPPACIGDDETLEDDSAYTEVRIIPYVNGGIERDSNGNYSFWGNCFNPTQISSSDHCVGIKHITSPTEIRAHKRIERSFLGQTSMSTSPTGDADPKRRRNGHPISLQEDSPDAYFDIEDWLEYGTGYESKVQNYHAGFPLCTGIGRAVENNTCNLSFGALVRTNVDFGTGFIEGDYSTYNWQNLFFMEHKIASMADQGTYHELQSGMQYIIGQRPTEMMPVKLFEHDGWHYYYWCGFTEFPLTLSVATPNGFSFPTFEPRNIEGPFKAEYLSAFLAIH